MYATKIVTTVVTPAASYDLTDLATVKTELKITSATDDTWLAGAITQASASVANYCRRVFPVETLKDVIYLDWAPRGYTRGTAGPLPLSRWPITAVASVTLGGANPTTLVQDTDFTVDAANGELIRISSATGIPMPWQALPTTVQYSAGYATIPAPVVEATLRLITARYKARGRDPMLKEQEQPGVGRETFWVGGPPMSGSLPQDIAAMLDDYRVPVAV